MYLVRIKRLIRLQIWSILILYFYISCAYAESIELDAKQDDYQSESDANETQYKVDAEVSIDIGALVIIGADFRIFYRKLDSPWLFGVRYLDTDDDFVNEGAVGLPDDESDRELTTTTGIYVNYLFNHLEDNSFYLSGALNATKSEIQCFDEAASDSATSLYFGGGYRNFWNKNFGFKLGVLISPFVNFELETPTGCRSESNNDIDLDVSLVFRF